MIKELVQFTEHLPEDVKNSGILPKEGLHILLNSTNNNSELSIDTVNYKYEIYNKPKPKEKPELSDFLLDCAMRSNHAWCINTNKCFDSNSMAIHTCSPFAFGFKCDSLNGGEKYYEDQKAFKREFARNKNSFYKKYEKIKDKIFTNQKLSEDEKIIRLKQLKKDLINERNEKLTEKRKGVSEIFNRVDMYFEKALALIDSEIDKEKLFPFVDFLKIELEHLNILNKIPELKKLRPNKDYIVFYLNETLIELKTSHDKYLKSNLFNTADYNTEPNEQGETYGTSGFFNGFNSKMPFLIHQTAPFDITSRISNTVANELYNFEKILGRGFMPNPLPIFIYKEELEQGMITIFRKNIKRGERIGYQEMVKELWNKHKSDFNDYYLLFHRNTKEGIVFDDFDFVSKFEYELKDVYNKQPWEILNLFELKEKKEGAEKPQNKFYSKIYNVFDLERLVFGNVLANKYKRFDFYFEDLKGKEFEQLDFTLIAVRKYRKAIYDYIYKSKRQAITGQSFKEIMLSTIKDDLKYGREYGIKEKLNIWFSINHHFDKHNINFNNHYMPDKLNQLFEKTMEIADSKERIPIENEYEFAFISGQLIDFLLSKSQSSDNSHNLLEAFLQKTDVELFKREISKYFARYKHAVEREDNGRFKHLMREVMGFDKKVNMQDLITFVLSGYFSNSFYYTKKNNQKS